MIRVTRDHISRGVPENPTKCPVALAVQEATGYPRVLVDEVTVNVGLEFGWLPDDAVRRIEEYDALEGMEPFEFELKTTPYVE